mgnify:CR=1 FL=1
MIAKRIKLLAVVVSCSWISCFDGKQDFCADQLPKIQNQLASHLRQMDQAVLVQLKNRSPAALAEVPLPTLKEIRGWLDVSQGVLDELDSSKRTGKLKADVSDVSQALVSLHAYVAQKNVLRARERLGVITARTQDIQAEACGSL